MKKQYQIDRDSAVRRFQKQAQEGEQELQLNLPLTEVAAALQESVGRLMRQAGLELMQLIMDNEVRSLAGERPSNPSAGDVRRAFWSWTGRRFRSSVRGCAARMGANNAWAATSCFGARSLSMPLFGTS